MTGKGAVRGKIEPTVLRIGVITETFPPEINGVANTLRHLVEGLEQRGHHVHLIRPRQDGERMTGPEGRRTLTLVPGLPIPGYRGLRFGLPVYWRVRRTWRRSRPDVVYIATEGPLGRAALNAARAVGIPVLTGFHTQFHQYSSHYGLGLLQRQIAESLRRFHNRSDATLVPTEELRVQLIQQGFQNVQVLGRGVDTALFDPRRRNTELRRSWGCGPSGRVLLSVGRLAAEKNLELILRTFQHVAAQAPDVKLVLVGDGPERERLRHAHPELILPGAKIGSDLAEHYASGDLFLFPSLTETFGNVVPEALASGLPVIAFDYAAGAACIRNGENGTRVPLGAPQAFMAAAAEVLSDDGRLRSLSHGARTSAELMSWGQVVRDLEQRLFAAIQLRSEQPSGTWAPT